MSHEGRTGDNVPDTTGAELGPVRDGVARAAGTSREKPILALLRSQHAQVVTAARAHAKAAYGTPAYRNRQLEWHQAEKSFNDALTRVMGAVGNAT